MFQNFYLMVLGIKTFYIGKLFRKFITRSDYPKIRFHDLRHSR